MSNQFFYLQLKFTPKIGHTFTDERGVVVKVRAALGTFPTEAERVVDLYDEDPPIWCHDRPPVMNERPCDHEEDGIRAWKIL
jgi:hypothetical protein